jgi:hypothetical protein
LSSSRSAYETLARVWDLRGVQSRGQCWLTTQLAVRVAAIAGSAHAATCGDAAAGYWLHDVGLLGVSDDVLGRADSANPIDQMALRRHPEVGAGLLAGLSGRCGCAVAVIRHHHEQWDGGGYPDGLSGPAIPEAARVFAVAAAVAETGGGSPEPLHAAAGNRLDPRIAHAVIDSYAEIWQDGLLRLSPRVPPLVAIAPWSTRSRRRRELAG